MTFAEIMDQRHKEAHERQAQYTKWAAEVTVQLTNERSKFMADFTESDRRMFGVSK